MNTVKCGVGECPSVFQTEEPLSPNARYICKLHTEAEQRVFFQENSFDKELSRAGKPIGTSHIQRQGWMPPSEEEMERWSEIQAASKEKK
jgi:hypothetical protein